LEIEIERCEIIEICQNKLNGVPSDPVDDSSTSFWK